MDDLRGSIAQAAAEDRSVWSGTARVERLAELLEARERLEAETLRALGDVLADRAWESDGACSPVAWLADRGSMTAREAARLVSAARLAREHATVGKSLAAGDVTTSHVQLITRAARHRERVFAEHVDVLVDAARTVAPEPFVKVARTWRHLADDVVAGGASGDGDRWWLDTSVTFEGAVRVDGLLDPEGGATFIARARRARTPSGRGRSASGGGPPRGRARRARVGHTAAGLTRRADRR